MTETNPYAPSAASVQSEAADLPSVSNVRGCGFGCLYTVLTWFSLAILAILLIPIVFQGPDWNHRGLGDLASGLIFWFIAIPSGIVAFFRKRRFVNRPSSSSNASVPKSSIDLGMIVGWVLLGAVVGVIVAIAQDADAERSGEIVAAWMMGCGSIGLVIYVFAKLFVRQR